VWRGLHLWRRAAVAAVVLGRLVISAGLISYGLRIQPANPAYRAMYAATPTPRHASMFGADMWYYWGQDQPLSQQP
jgi:hypothetical protein